MPVRIRDGHFAYDIEPVYDPHTYVSAGWKYRIYALHPERQLAMGMATTREEAEGNAQREMDSLKEGKQTKEAA